MDNKEIVRQFYTSFQKLDAAGMNACYSDEVVFSDPVFLVLKDDEVRAMWEMLCSNARKFSLEFSDIEIIDEEYVTCKWQATYLFSSTRRMVTNHAKAYMRIQNGKITEHSDAFRLSSWIAKAIGWKGVLFGWTEYMKKAVQTRAKRGLLDFMEKKYS